MMCGLMSAYQMNGDDCAFTIIGLIVAPLTGWFGLGSSQRSGGSLE